MSIPPTIHPSTHRYSFHLIQAVVVQILFCFIVIINHIDGLSQLIIFKLDGVNSGRAFEKREWRRKKKRKEEREEGKECEVKTKK
jgi:hypothetical protein